MFLIVEPIMYWVLVQCPSPINFFFEIKIGTPCGRNGPCSRKFVETEPTQFHGDIERERDLQKHIGSTEKQKKVE